MDIPSERRQHLDPYEVHKENMQMLKVLPVTHNRSAPNSPMMKRTKERAALNVNFLSPSPQRKDITRVTEESRSRSLTHLTVGDGNSSVSPVGSPLSVSDRIIQTHFLSNTTGNPGSYLLKKSDEMVRSKESSTELPRLSPSPSQRRTIASPILQIIAAPSDNNDKLSTPTTIPVVISPATGRNKIGFELPHADERQTHSENDPILHISNQADSFEDGEHQLENIRESIGLALKPKPLPLPVVTKKILDKKKESSNKTSASKKNDKAKRHHYVKYGNTNKSPGLLSPPLEPRGSKDLSAEMEIWERKERDLFEDLDHVEEDSVGQSDEDHFSVDERDQSKGPPGVFTMPPVFGNKSHQLEARDFSVPMDIQTEMDEETLEQTKRCRYLRIEEQTGEDDGNDEDIFESDEEEEEMKSEDEDGN